MAKKLTKFKQAALLFVLKKTVADMMAKEVAEDRKQMLPELVKPWKSTGSKNAVVTLPNGDKVATLTLTEKKPEVKVKDSDALLAWADENIPYLVRTDVIPEVPAVPEREEKRLAAGALDTILEGARWDESAKVYVTADGDVIPGVEYVKSGDPQQFSVTYEKGKAGIQGGQERIMNAYHAGDLGELTLGTTLPQIEGPR